MDIQAVTAKMKADSSRMAALSLETRNYILKNVKEALLKNQEEIFKANKMDMDAADENGVTEAGKKRLKFDEHKLSDVTQGIEELIKLDDPIGKIQFRRQLDEGLTLHRITCPIGVIGIIFEARPDALVQISSLCIKSGNCAVLKGGKETTNTNKVLFQIIYQTAVESGAPSGCMYQAELHSEIDELLACHKSVDLLIPRGSNKFVQYIMNNTKIPVMGHADGICHTYLDRDADMEKAVSIIVDAKTQYTAACNSTETLLVDRAIAEEKLELIAEKLKEQKVILHGTKEVSDIISCAVMEEEEFNTEYLDLEISIKFVDGVEEAIDIKNPSPNRKFTCAVDDFFAMGGDNYLPTNEKPDFIVKKYDVDKNKLACDYIKKLDQPMEIRDDQRVKIVKS